MTKVQRWTYRLLMVVGLAALGVFYGWWLQPEHLPNNFSGPAHVLDIVIFLLLTSVVSHRVFMELYTWYVMGKIPSVTDAPIPEPGKRVAFITTFVPGVEGLQLLTATLPAMLAAEYPHDTWLLDEGDDPEAKALCESLGVLHFSRRRQREYNLVAGPFTKKTKGGNHNAWYDSVGDQYDFVAQIDTDFIARPDFLTETLGYFSDSTIAWVGTPQVYGNTDSFIARGAAQQQYSFYGTVLRGLSGFRMTNMIGANHVVRVAALREIGFYAGHLTEDLLTGMRLHARGWKSTYVAKPLAIGEGPETWQAYFNQQMRWAYGCIDILRDHSVKLTSTMPRRWAMLYLSLQQGYFSGLAGFTGVALLAAYFFGGVQISQVPLVGLIIWGAPFYAMRGIIGFWSQQFFVRPKVERGLHVAGRILSLAVWPIYLLAFVGVLRRRPLIFKVTPKGGTRQISASPVRLFRPHLILAGVSLSCVVAAVFQPSPSLVLLAWAIINTVCLGSFAIAAVVASLRLRSTPKIQIAQLQKEVISAAPTTKGDLVLCPERPADLVGADAITATALSA